MTDASEDHHLTKLKEDLMAESPRDLVAPGAQERVVRQGHELDPVEVQRLFPGSC